MTFEIHARKSETSRHISINDHNSCNYSRFTIAATTPDAHTIAATTPDALNLDYMKSTVLNLLSWAISYQKIINVGSCIIRPSLILPNNLKTILYEERCNINSKFLTIL